MATTADVARLAGVSVATVSRALSGQGNVTPETTEKVLRAARELDFQPDLMAQGLRRGKSNTVALVVADIQQGVNPTLAKCIQTALGELGLDLMLYDLGHDLDRLDRLLARAVGMRLNGLIMAATDVLPKASVAVGLAKLMEHGITVVACGQSFDRQGIPSVIHEEAAAVERSVSYLIERGLTPVAFAGRVTGSVLGRERYKGYQQALKRHGIALDDSLVWDRAYRYQAGYDSMLAALERGIRFRSLQASSDEIALGAMAALQDAGLRVPEDVALIGAGNVEWSRHVRPALTTLGSQPKVMADHIQAIFRAHQEGRAPRKLSVVPRPFLIQSSA